MEENLSIALKADAHAIRLVFADANKKPYYIRTFKNLIRFLEDPTTSIYAGPGAREAWTQLSMERRAEILRARDVLLEQCNGILFSITQLKNSNDNAEADALALCICNRLLTVETLIY